MRKILKIFIATAICIGCVMMTGCPASNESEVKADENIISANNTSMSQSAEQTDNGKELANSGIDNTTEMDKLEKEIMIRCDSFILDLVPLAKVNHCNNIKLEISVGQNEWYLTNIDSNNVYDDGEREYVSPSSNDWTDGIDHWGSMSDEDDFIGSGDNRSLLQYLTRKFGEELDSGYINIYLCLYEKSRGICKTLNVEYSEEPIIHLPDFIGDDISNFEYEAFSDYVMITKYIGSSNVVSIPNIIDGLPVTVIGENAFYENHTVSSVTIPSTVTQIGKSAFSECIALTDVVIPDSVNVIGDTAFAACSSITQITIPNSVNSIGSWAFAGNGLKEVIVPESVTYLGDGAFRGCESLESAEILGKIEILKEDTFIRCKSLTRVVLPEGLREIQGSTVGRGIEEGAFGDCTSLTEIVIPDTVWVIGHEVFRGCDALTSVDMSDNIEKVGWVAFLQRDNTIEVKFRGKTLTLDEFYEYSTYYDQDDRYNYFI